MLFRISWLAILIIICCYSTWFTKRWNNNSTLLNFSGVFLGTIFCGLLWTYVSKHSKSLIVDSAAYDITLFLSYAGFFALLGCGQGFTLMNWIGLVICCIGFIMMAL